MLFQYADEKLNFFFFFLGWGERVHLACRPLLKELEFTSRSVNLIVNGQEKFI
jgi:hypothetical protein